MLLAKIRNVRKSCYADEIGGRLFFYAETKKEGEVSAEKAG